MRRASKLLAIHRVAILTRPSPKRSPAAPFPHRVSLRSQSSCAPARVRSIDLRPPPYPFYCSSTYREAYYAEEDEEGNWVDTMEHTARSVSTTSSGDKKRKRAAPAYFAVRKGRKPGIYFSWPDAQEQTKEFPGSEYKKFTSYAEAEAFNKGDNLVAFAASKAKISQEKWYGVQVGHNPGVYTDYDEVKRQVRGYPGSKQQRFATREEAQAFVDTRNGDTAAYASATSTAPSIKEDVGSDMSLHATAVRKLKPGDNVLKKQKKNYGYPAVILPNGDLEPGTGPLPLDAEDGFDRTITLRPDTGQVEFRTEEELDACKWQPTGDYVGPLVIYTDGAAPGNGRAGAAAGVGVYFGRNDPNNVSDWLGEGKQTNQRAELGAMRRAVDLAPINRDVLIISDSDYSIKCLTVWSQKWMANGWKTASGRPVDNKDIIEPTLERMNERMLSGAKTKFEWVKGHANDPGNVAADRLAVQGAQKGLRMMLAMQEQKTREEWQNSAQLMDGEEAGLEFGSEGDYGFGHRL